MPRKWLASNVLEASVQRMVKVYEEGHRVVVSFSGGKDSGTILEVCILAARRTGNLPVDVLMRDEEIMLPGTFEYAERTAALGASPAQTVLTMCKKAMEQAA